MSSRSQVIFAALIASAFASSAIAQPAFVDVSQNTGLIFTSGYGPTYPGLDAMSRSHQRNMGNGIAVGDYDNDGDLDVYFCANLDQSNKLFRNNIDSDDKTFTDVTETAGVGHLGLSRVAQFADLDNDGFIDLIVVNDDDGTDNYPTSRIFRNNRDGTFADMTDGSGFRPIGYLHMGLAVADYDLDGDLDVYVTAWTREVATGEQRFLGSNRLLRNDGDFTFTDVTESVGLGTLAQDSFSTIFHDFDGNGYPDIFVAMDFRSDEFFWNNGGIFTHATANVGATHTGNDMGAACVDFDDDGDLDIYTTNITDPTFPPFGYPTQGNCFYVNQTESEGADTFLDQAAAHGCVDTHWGWGVEFDDLENDGDLDIVAGNGYDEQILWLNPNSLILNKPTVILLNDGSSNFSRGTVAGFENGEDTRAVIAFDYDRDGDRDLLIGNVNQPCRLMENVTPNSGHWLTVKLFQGASGNRNALGASVFARIGSTTKRREIMTCGSFISGRPAEAHFGLGNATTIDELTIRWPGGNETTITNVAVDQLLVISRIPGDCAADGILNGDDVAPFIEALMNGGPVCDTFESAGPNIGDKITAFVDAMLSQ